MTEWWEAIPDSFIDRIMSQIEWCKYCGDGIPKHQMAEHVAWCKPLIEENQKKRGLG